MHTANIMSGLLAVRYSRDPMSPLYLVSSNKSPYLIQSKLIQFLLHGQNPVTVFEGFIQIFGAPLEIQRPLSHRSYSEIS